MLDKFDFVLPTSICFGKGRSKDVGKKALTLNGTKAMIVTDKGIVAAGLIENIKNALLEENIGVIVFDEVEPNPRDTMVERGAKIAKDEGVDILIAVGGGSSMDTAKAIGIVLTHGGVINDYEGYETVTKPITPLIAIPTTVGTGSEVTFWAVITDTKRHFKMSVGSPLIAPRIALVDPELVENLPPKIIASTGMDALTHAIEGYTCTLAEPITDACGIYAIKMIAENIKAAVYDDSKDARSKMLLGSLIAGICFGNSDVAGVHCMAESLGGLYDTPHGIANAVLLPYVMEYNYISNVNKFAEVAKAMGETVDGKTEKENAYMSVEAVRKLNSDLKIPTLIEVGASAEDLPELAKRSSCNVSVGSNPRKIDEEDFLKIFQKAYQ